MADIKQAAKWMKEGRKVRREAWHVLVVEQRGSAIEDADAKEYSRVENPLDADDLLANDWKLAD